MSERSLTVLSMAVGCTALAALCFLGPCSGPPRAVSPDGRVASLVPSDPYPDPVRGTCTVRVLIEGGPSSPLLDAVCVEHEYKMPERLSWEGTSWRLLLTSPMGTQWLYDLGEDWIIPGRADPRQVPPGQPLSQETRQRLDRLPPELRARLPLRETRIPEPPRSEGELPRTSLSEGEEWVNDDPNTLVVISGRGHVRNVFSRGPVLLEGQATARGVYTSSWALIDDWAYAAYFSSTSRVFTSEQSRAWDRSQGSPRFERVPSLIPRELRAWHPPPRALTGPERQRLLRFGFPEAAADRLSVVELQEDYSFFTNNQRDFELEDPNILLVLGPGFRANGSVRSRGPVLVIRYALHFGPVDSESWVMVDDCAYTTVPLRGERVLVNRNNAVHRAFDPEGLSEPGSDRECSRDAGAPVDVTSLVRDKPYAPRFQPAPTE